MQATTVIGKHGIIQPRLHYQSTAAKKDNGVGQGGEGGAAAAIADDAARGGGGRSGATAAAGETEEDAAERLRNLQRMGDWGR